MDMNGLLSLAIFAASLLGLGVWALYLTRRTPEQEREEEERLSEVSRAEYAELTERLRAAEELLKLAEESPPFRIVVRNPTTGQLRGVYRRTARAAIARLAHES